MDKEFPGAFSDLAAGSQIAGDRIVEQIGRGGMAVVYRARDIRLDRWVALKILAPDLARDQVFRQRFIRESRAAAAVDHPNIIPIFEAGEADGVLFIAMRYVGGQDVRSLLDRVGALPAERAAGIVTQVASALDAAHACGLVHRDVKPANMLLDDRAESGAADHVYLSDFGVSKQSEATSNLPAPGNWSAPWTIWPPSRSRAARWTGARTSTRWPVPRSRCSPGRRPSKETRAWRSCGLSCRPSRLP